MKKMTTIIIVAILLPIIGFVIYNTIQQKSILIIKSIEIEAPVNNVFEMVANQNNFHKWSPFMHKDPSLKYDIKEVDGIVGTKLYWTGGKDNKDLGCQTVIQVDELKYIGIRCDIEQPFTTQSTFNYSFTALGEKTVVKQEFKMESSFVSALFMWIFGAKKEIDTNNELGLQLLKKISEDEK